jgi:hypothetical protein
MLKLGLRSFCILTFVIIFYSCIDPYTPKLKGYESLLVVEGLITDANTSYTIKVSKSFQQINAESSAVSDATVFITDDKGSTNYLSNKGNGIYKTDSLEFRGEVGRTYTLDIQTKDGEVYESDHCPMLPVADIESIYFARDQELVNNETVSKDGITIYLDTKAGNNNSFYRWDFDETWKYRIPNPKRFDYFYHGIIRPTQQRVEEYCWKDQKSNGIIVNGSFSGQPGKIVRQPIFFIATGESDRLMLEYSILVRQYSISANEYYFWKDLQKVNEKGSDIFASLPFSVISNIHNLRNSTEKILGYFQVSSVKEKRIFITFNEILKFHTPYYYDTDCRIFEDVPKPGWGLDDMYNSYCVYSDYVFIGPYYDVMSGSLIGLTFSRPECTICGAIGTLKRPAYWVDL